VTNSISVPDGFPELEGLRKLLTPWHGTTAFVISMLDTSGAMLGNNGDKLMHTVFYRILEDLNITITTNGNEAAVIIVPPNGALLEVYQFPRLLAERLRGFEQLPLVIFPSSAYFATTNPIFMFEGRKAKTLWIFREKFSFDHIRSKWGQQLSDAGIEIELDHDVVATGHKFVPELFKSHRVAELRALVAGRIDREARPIGENRPAQGLATARLFGRASRLIPYGRLRTTLTRQLRRERLVSAGTEMMTSLGTPPVIHGSPRFVDASATQYATFQEYLSWIAGSSIVVTNRLHVALPAAILGKDVVLVEAGYHKLEGVYMQSLVRVDNVQFVNPHHPFEVGAS